jgi:hypothetical protein
VSSSATASLVVLLWFVSAHVFVDHALQDIEEL